MSKPTDAQLTCLRLAAHGPIAYYKGGWYAPQPASGAAKMQQRARRFDTHGDVWTNPGTLRACLERQWMTVSPDGDIYRIRWTITDSGRAELARATRKEG